MAVKTWDTSRVGGGTYELERDSSGNYKLKTVGFDQVSKLTLPDLLTQDKTTTTTKTDTTKTDDTTDTAAPYKQLAKANLGDDTQQDYTGTMVKGGLSKKGNIDRTTSMLKDDVYADARQAMTTDAAYRGKTESFPGRSRIDPTNPLDTVYDAKPIYASDMIASQESTKGGLSQRNKIDRSPAVIGDQETEVGNYPTEDISTTEFPGRSKTIGGKWVNTAGEDVRATPFGTDVDKYQGFTADSKALGIDTTAPATGGVQWVKDTISNPRDSNYSGWIQKSVLDKHIADKKAKLAKVSKIPIIGGIARAGSIISDILPRTWRSTDTQKFNKSYFNLRGGNTGDRRIAGNPANDLYAGMNRTSAYGNLEKSGAKRIATIEKTLSRTNLKASTRKALEERRDKFKEQQKDYRKAKNKELVKKAVQKGASVSNPAEMHAATGGGGGADSGKSGRVICTELHRTKEMATHDWVRDIKFTYNNLSKDHIKGYLFWAVPTVNLIKKYPTYRKIWKHLAQHRANDIAWRLNQGKFDLLGRIYAGIGEPLCWLIGKCVSDKQLKELKLNSWRRA